METTTITTETVIETALAEQNVTAQIISKLKEDYSGLKINGIDDKVGFKKVEEGRKQAKALRVLAVKICKEGRDFSNKVSKDWITKEKEIVSLIEEIEIELETESNRIKDEEKAILFKAAQEAKLPMRKEKLLSIGVEVEDSQLLKIDDAQFFQLFNEFYEKHLEEKAEIQRQENLKRQAEEEAKKEEERRIEAEKLEIERKEKERILAEEKAKVDAENARLKTENEIKEKALKEQQAKADAELLEQKRISDLEAKKQAEIISKQKAESDAKIEALKKEAEQKELAEKQRLEIEEAKKQAELSMGDKPKMEAFFNDLEILKLKYEFKAAKYKTLQSGLNELIEKTIVYGKSKI